MCLLSKVRERLKHSGTKSDNWLTLEYLNKRLLIEANWCSEKHAEINDRLAKLELSQQDTRRTKAKKRVRKNAPKDTP